MWRKDRTPVGCGGGPCAADNSLMAETIALVSSLWKAEVLFLTNLLIRMDSQYLLNFVQGTALVP